MDLKDLNIFKDLKFYHGIEEAIKEGNLENHIIEHYLINKEEIVKFNNWERSLNLLVKRNIEDTKYKLLIQGPLKEDKDSEMLFKIIAATPDERKEYIITSVSEKEKIKEAFEYFLEQVSEIIVYKRQRRMSSILYNINKWCEHLDSTYMDSQDIEIYKDIKNKLKELKPSFEKTNLSNEGSYVK